MRTRLKSKVSLLFMMLGLLLAIPAVALAADAINADLIDYTSQNANYTAGSANGVVTEYWVQADTDGCDPGDGGAVSFKLSVKRQSDGADVSAASFKARLDTDAAGSEQALNNFTLTLNGCAPKPPGSDQFPTTGVFKKVVFTSDANLAAGQYKVEINGSTISDTNDPASEYSPDNQNSFLINVSADTSTPPANEPPTADAGGPYVFDEGDSTNALSGSGTDPEDDAASPAVPLTYAWDLDNNGSFETSGQNPNFDATSIDGPATRQVTVQVTDSGGLSDTDTATVTIDNVAPTASNGTFNLNPILGTATAGFAFGDASTLDTHGPNLSYFTWSGVGDTGNRAATVTETNGSGTASDSRTLATGCYPNLGVTGTAVDDDNGASDPLTIYSSSNNTPTGIYSKAFRPPIVDNERNIAKYGNVVPVKVQITNPCTGTTVTNAALYITVAKGLNGEFIEDNNPVAESVSAADNGQQMRVVDGGYIYNLSTKSLSQNTDWAVRVRLGATDGPIILQAVLYPKK